MVRKVVCELVGRPGKVNWRDCERSEEGVREDRERVRKVLGECHLGEE